MAPPSGETYSPSSSNSTNSLCGALLRTLCTIILGFAAILFSLGFLFWNEGRSVKTSRVLSTAQAVVISVPCAPVDPQFNGKLVSMACGLSHIETFTELPNINVTVTAIWVERVVEMYQWHESSHSREVRQSDGSYVTETEYSYYRQWSDHPINSNGFHESFRYSNPTFWPIKGERMWSKDIRMGDFKVPLDLAQQTSLFSSNLGFTSSAPVVLPADSEHTQSIEGHPPQIVTDYNTRLYDNCLYTGDPSGPVVGDLRVSWKASSATSATVVAQQLDQTFTRWHSSEGADYPVYLLEEGLHDATEVIAHAYNANTLMTFVLRGAGFVLCWMGLLALVYWVSSALRHIPAVGWLLEGIASCTICVVTCILACILSLLTMASGYILYRPFLVFAASVLQ